MPTYIRDLRLFADGAEIAQFCRVRLDARETLSLLPQLCHLEIENLSDSSTALLSGARSVEARTGDSILFSGEILTCCPRVQSGRSILSLDISPGFPLWQSSVSLSLSAGLSVSDTFRAVLAASLQPSGQPTAVPLCAFTADDIRLTRPQSFFGRTCDALRSLADSVQAHAFLSPAGLSVISRRPASPTLTLPPEALLSDPVFLPDCILLTTSILGWPLGASLQFTWRNAPRSGLLASRLLHLDNVSGPWLSQLEVLL